MAEGRLSELQAAQEYNLSLSRQCEDIEVYSQYLDKDISKSNSCS